MTRDEAEQIFLANEVGMFKGSQNELAIAVLILSQPSDEHDSSVQDIDPDTRW